MAQMQPDILNITTNSTSTDSTEGVDLELVGFIVITSLLCIYVCLGICGAKLESSVFSWA